MPTRADLMTLRCWACGGWMVGVHPLELGTELETHIRGVHAGDRGIRFEVGWDEADEGPAPLPPDWEPC